MFSVSFKMSESECILQPSSIYHGQVTSREWLSVNGELGPASYSKFMAFTCKLPFIILRRLHTLFSLRLSNDPVVATGQLKGVRNYPKSLDEFCVQVNI